MGEAEKFNVLQRGAELFKDPLSCDVNFIFGYGDEQYSLPAHKAILASNSDVFDAMFYGALAEAGNAIQIIDISRIVFERFLRYFYFGATRMNESNVAGLLYLADKYNVKQCRSDCIGFLNKNLDDANLSTILELAILFGDSKLQTKCEKKIVANTEHFLASISFIESSLVTVKHILKMKVLSCTEAKLLQSCLAWVQAKRGDVWLTKVAVEEHVGNLFWTNICFGALSIAELRGLRDSFEDVIRHEDFVEISTHILRSTQDSAKFNMKKRQPMWSNEAAIFYDRNTLNWNINYRTSPGGIEYVNLSVIRPLLLGALTFAEIYAGQPDDPMETTVTLSLLISEGPCVRNGNAAKELFADDITISTNAAEILLYEPILLVPERTYTIRLVDMPAGHMFIDRYLTFTDGSILVHHRSSSIVVGVAYNNIF